MARKYKDPASAIDAVRAWLITCPFLADKAGEIVIEYPDLMDETATVKAGLASNGSRTIRSYIDGTIIKEHSFVLQTRAMTIEDADRLANSEFYENLVTWIDERVKERDLPTAAGFSFASVTASNAMLYDLQDDGDMGTYQVQLQTEYTKRSL
ncbi:MAG: hypothetical protein ACOX3W_00435 [Christensenellaceae bacterium]|jgi:hypothetical protein